MNVNGSANNVGTLGPPQIARRMQKGRLIAMENDPNKVKNGRKFVI